MEPEELQATLHLLVSLLVPCMDLLCCLNGLLLLHHQNSPQEWEEQQPPMLPCNLEKRAMLVPPNLPACSWATWALSNGHSLPAHHLTH
ncbi:UNVERIFIED_CONTAM: hypothetical protein K2H54_034267 [Gekko kuhli]